MTGTAPTPAAPSPGRAGEDGAALWDFLRRFVSARRTFLSIQRRYEQRVTQKCRDLDVSRENLVLPPGELFELFNLRRLAFLKETRLKPLRELAEEIFGARGDDELLDVYCSHIYHELSILNEEHRSVGRFLRIQDRRRYRQLFEEVSGYYPKRLQRIRRLFTGGMRRIEILLPGWAEHRVVVRSVYLFGNKLAGHAYGKGVEALYVRMYPEGREIQGYFEAARSFTTSGFMTRAREAAQRGVDAADALAARRVLERPEQDASTAVRDLLAQLDAEAGVEAPA
jgi:hypothetical protein